MKKKINETKILHYTETEKEILNYLKEHGNNRIKSILKYMIRPDYKNLSLAKLMDQLPGVGGEWAFLVGVDWTLNLLGEGGIIEKDKPDAEDIFWDKVFSDIINKRNEELDWEDVIIGDNGIEGEQ